MQKMIYCVLFNILCSSALASNASLNGIYAGGAFGLISAHVDDKYQYEINLYQIAGSVQTVKFSSSVTDEDSTLTGGLSLGWQHALKQFFLFGIEGRVNFEGLDKEIQRTIINNTAVETNNFFMQADVNLNYDIDFLLKLGFVLQPQTILYGVIGPAFGHFNVTNQASTNSSQTDFHYQGLAEQKETSYRTGLLLGLGLEHFIGEHVSISLEYTHVDYGNLNMAESLSTPLNLSGFLAQFVSAMTLTAENTMSVKTDTVVLRCNYHFG